MSDLSSFKAAFFEDEHPKPRFLIERYMKTMIATKSIKI
jgi:hypothetical protein